MLRERTVAKCAARLIRNYLLVSYLLEMDKNHLFLCIVVLTFVVTTVTTTTTSTTSPTQTMTRITVTTTSTRAIPTWYPYGTRFCNNTVKSWIIYYLCLTLLVV